MSHIEKTIQLSRQAEHVLETRFGAQGRGLHEKLSSVEPQIPTATVRQLRYFATIRNKLMHEHEYQLENPEEFFQVAALAVAALEQVEPKPHLVVAEVESYQPQPQPQPQPQQKPSTQPKKTSKSGWKWLLFGVLLLAGCVFLLLDQQQLAEWFNEDVAAFKEHKFAVQAETVLRGFILQFSHWLQQL